MKDRIKVMLTTEGTYPFHQGGVSTWCNALVSRLSSVDYIIYSIIMNPFVVQKFGLPPSAHLLKVPLWGTEEPSEHLVEIPFSQVYAAKRRTLPAVIKEHFIPLFTEMVTEIFAREKNSIKLGHTFFEMHSYFQEYDYRVSFKSETTWNAFKAIALQQIKGEKERLFNASIFDLNQSLGWLYRFMVILNTPLPNADVSHSAAAAFCGIPCVLAKIKGKTPFLLTEHGVYLREQYLAASRQGLSSYLKTFLIQLVRSITALNYAYADQVSPVCAYNTRWEKEMGVEQKKIKVIYNGVDPAVFAPGGRQPALANPTVVAVARVDPIKDLVTLIKAAAVVKEIVPKVKFILYGSVTVPSYYQECLELRDSLRLEDTFIFAGHTDDVPAAYRSGDIIALSSISEAFPYSVVEAMMSGKPVVATDVGGVGEAVKDCGITVRPRRPDELAAALIKLLEDDRLRFEMGENARQRALTYFAINRMVELYLAEYRALAGRRDTAPWKPQVREKQGLYAQRGYALASSGFWKEALAQFRLAVEIDVRSPAVPVLLLEMARVYNELGRGDLALNELEKARAMAVLIEGGQVA